MGALIVGAGFTGLAAARELAAAGVAVDVIDPGPPGGAVRASAFAGTTLDEGADNFLARVPEAVALCEELGLGGDLVAPAARRAMVWSRGQLRPLPTQHVLGVPCDLDELAATGIVSDEGVAGAAEDLERPYSPPEGDVAIGALVRDRLGDEVLERLVDPLVGGINAGDTDRLSLAATVPQLDAAARSGASSLIAACRAQRAAIDTTAPVFYAPRDGMGAMVEALAADVADRGARLRTDTVTAIERTQGRWRVTLAGGGALDAAAVLVTAPAPVAGRLVGAAAPAASSILAGITYAGIAMVALAVPQAALDADLAASGFLVPRCEGLTITACTFTTSKWPHLAPDGTTSLLRVAVGRDGDDRGVGLDDGALVAAVVDDLRRTVGLRGEPDAVRVSRWPVALPQYRPGHLGQVAALRQALAAAPGLVVAGAALDGLGVPACIRQGRTAARDLLTVLDEA